MEMTMSEAFHAEEEIAASTSYDNIRMFNVERMMAREEAPELAQQKWQDGWASASRSDRVADFSAVCLFFARTIIDSGVGPKVAQPCQVVHLFNA